MAALERDLSGLAKEKKGEIRVGGPPKGKLCCCSRWRGSQEIPLCNKATLDSRLRLVVVTGSNFMADFSGCGSCFECDASILCFLVGTPVDVSFASSS